MTAPELPALSRDGDAHAMAEQFIAAAIDRAPEPARRLGEYLADHLDDDAFGPAGRMLLGLIEQVNAVVVGADEVLAENDRLRLALRDEWRYSDVLREERKRLRSAIEQLRRDIEQLDARSGRVAHDGEDRRRHVVKGGALILAEMERLARAAKAGGGA